jgi:chaperonin GroES
MGGKAQMKIRPLHDRILVERLEEKEVKKGGIIIPDTAKEKPQEAKVIAVGNGKVGDDGKKIPLDVKAATHPLRQVTPAPRSSWRKRNTLILREEDILAILE